MQDDVQAFRLYEFDKCIKTLQIPCRWIPDGGAGYGYPLFNYYPPLPYAIGEVIHLLGPGIIDSVKILFILGFLGASLSMYFLVAAIWGKEAGLVSSVLYLYAPYRSVDSYVRGALGEFWGLSLVPLVLLGTYLIIVRKKWGFIVLVAALACLILTHLLSLLMLAPLLLVWTGYWLVKSGNYSAVLRLVASSLSALGLSAFFWLPAFAEKGLVTINTMTQGYFDFRGHFATLNQLFVSRFWGYGASLFGRSDMSLAIGHLQWLIPTVVFIIALVVRRKKIVGDAFFYVSLLFGFFYAFMAHNKSTGIWLSLPFMSFLQFPWRFVGLSVLSFSLAIGALRLKSLPLITIIIISVLTINLGYFREDIWYPDMTDARKLSPAAIPLQNISGLKDYWPSFGITYPTQQAPENPIYLSGEGSATTAWVGTNVIRYDIRNQKDSTIELPLVYFSNWKAFNQISGQEIPVGVSQPLGTIAVDLPKGETQLVLKLFDTPIRSVANAISLVSLVVITLALWTKRPHLLFS
jgi:hypothetical protein